MKVAGLVALAVVLSAAPAAAQTVRRDSPPRVEVAVGGLFPGPMALGSANAELIRPNDSPFVEFRTDNSLGPGFGVETTVAVLLSGRLAVEGGAGWSRMNLRTHVSGDVEDVPATTITEPISRVTVEGHLLWSIRSGAKTTVFLRGGAGWMRELTSGATLVEDGTIGNVGLGVKYWWRTRLLRQGGSRRVGLRFEARALVRSGGVSLGPQGVRIAPAGLAGVVFGF